MNIFNIFRAKCYFCGKPATNNNMCHSKWDTSPGTSESYHYHLECLRSFIHQPSHVDYIKNRVALEISEAIKYRAMMNETVVNRLKSLRESENVATERKNVQRLG